MDTNIAKNDDEHNREDELLEVSSNYLRELSLRNIIAQYRLNSAHQKIEFLEEQVNDLLKEKAHQSVESIKKRGKK